MQLGKASAGFSIDERQAAQQLTDKTCPGNVTALVHVVYVFQELQVSCVASQSAALAQS